MKQFAAVAVIGLWSWAAHAQTVCTSVPMTVPLLAKSTIPAGTVTASNDNTNLYVTFTTTGDWTIGQLDVAVATSLAGIPQDSNGQPVPSQFPFRKSFCPEVTTYKFTIPLGTITPGTPLYIAAHASLDSPTLGHAQAWGTGLLFPGSKVCTPSRCGCDGEHDGEDCNGDHGDHGDGRRHDSSLHDGGGDQCGGDHHGDNQRAILQHGGEEGGGGQNQCGGGHDHGDHQGAILQDGGGDGGHHDEGDDGDEDDMGHQCGAAYFVYVVNCKNVE